MEGFFAVQQPTACTPPKHIANQTHFSIIYFRQCQNSINSKNTDITGLYVTYMPFTIISEGKCSTKILKAKKF